MSLFASALGGLGRAAGDIADTYIKTGAAKELENQRAANNTELERVRAANEEAKARLIAELQRENIDYTNSPDVVAAAAEREGKITRAKSENTAHNVSPGGKVIFGAGENDTPTAAELVDQQIRDGLRTPIGNRGGSGSAGSGSGKGKSGAVAAPGGGLDTKHIKAQRDLLGDKLAEAIEGSPDASSMFDQLVSHNRNLPAAQAARLALDAAATLNTSAEQPATSKVKVTQSIAFTNGKPYAVPSITDGSGNEYFLGGAAQTPLDRNAVAAYLNDSLIPRAAATAPVKGSALARQLGDTIRFLGLSPDEFQSLLDDYTAGASASAEEKRLRGASAGLGKRTDSLFAAAQAQMRSAAQPPGTVINPATGLPPQFRGR